MAVGNGTLRSIRTTLGMSQRRFADMLEIGESTIRAYESGKVQVPRTVMLAAVAVAIFKIHQQRQEEARRRRPFG
jgi:DNA-binding transcriptional regulator YiaG